MKILLSLDPDSKELHLDSERIRPANGSVSGALHHKVLPGETFAGLSYRQLVGLGDGWHELDLSTPAEASRAAV